MIKILTSSFNNYYEEDNKKIAKEIDNANNIIDDIKNNLKNNNTIIFIASNPLNKDKIKSYSTILFESLKLSNIVFENYIVIDDVDQNIKKNINEAAMIFLCGGSTYTQNKFFKDLNLKQNLKDFNGLVIGQSAGSLNMSEDVFNSPEELEDSEPIYFKGLGLTNINIEPHFILDEKDFNEKEKYQRNKILEESNKRYIYGQCDGSHIIVDERNKIIICGKTYLIKDEKIKLICNSRERKEVILDEI